MQNNSSALDLFISYRHSVPSDRKAVQSMAEQLQRKGLQVFRDERSIDTFDSITQTIQHNLSSCKALLVYLTQDYLSSRACVWEFNAAFIASQKLGTPAERIFIVNPENTTELLKKLPVELQDAKYTHSVEVALEEIPQRLELLNGTFENIGPLTAPRLFGRSILTGSNRFAGRLTEMWEIHSNLNASLCTLVTACHTGPDIAQVSGMGGIGKTLLAEEYALRFGAAYPGGIYWLDAHGSFNPHNPNVEVFKSACKDQYLKILHAHGQNPPLDTPFESIRAAVARIIKQAKGRILWIVDDIPYGLADHLDAVKAWFAPHPSACTLVTTRSREYNAMGKELPLYVLEEADAFDLLEYHVEDLTDQRDAAVKLIERLGGHAMALDIAGAAIANYGDTAEAYLKELDEDIEDLIDASPDLIGALPSGHERSIVATYKHSLLKLGNDSKDYLRLAANLSPAVIPNAFAEKVFALSDGLEKTLARKFTRQAIAGCYNNSLVKPVGNSQQVHALTSAVVQYLGWSMDERAAAIRADAIDSLTETIQSDITHDEAVKIGPELEHARHLTAGGIGEVELNLLYKLARFDDYRGYFQQAMESYKRLLTYYQDENGPDHPDTLTIMGNLAFTLREMGDYSAAKELEEKVLEQRTRILGPDHLDTLTSMDNLAGSLGAMGDHKGAKKLAEKVFKSRKKVLGPDHPDTLKSMGNIAMLFEAMGEYTSAKKLAEKVFEQSTRILGPDHPDTLTFMNNMAGIMVLTGEYKQAKQLFAQIIEIRKENLGSDHPDTLTSMNNMAGTLWNMGEYKEAKQILTQVFEIRREALGLDHPQTLKTMSNLAENLKAIGDHKGAKQIQEQVLEDMKEILGPDHPDTLASMGNLGNILFETGDQIGAKQLQEEALKYRNKTLGPDHSDTLTSMHNLARVLSAMEDHNGAKQLQELALKGMKEIFGSDHPNTTVIAWHLFKTLINLNEMQASARVMCEYLLWLLDDNITIHNRNQQNIRDSIKELNTNMSSLAKAMVDIGEYNRAKKILVPELERRAQTLGPDHPDTTSAAWNLYATLLQLREINGAKKIISKHLLWLLEENVTLRDSDQKQIRDNLKKILDGTHWFKNRESLQYGGPESSLSTTYRKLRYYVRRLLGV